MSTIPYSYGIAAITDWYDGDTPHGVLDLGDGLAMGSKISIGVDASTGTQFVVIKPQRFRIAGLKAPELHDPKGLEARDKAAELVRPGMYQILRFGLDKWRRPLVDFQLKNGELFSHAMQDVGYGRPVSITDQLAA